MTQRMLDAGLPLPGPADPGPDDDDLADDAGIAPRGRPDGRADGRTDSRAEGRTDRVDGRTGGPADGAEEPTSEPWRILRRQQDRRRYLRILTPPRVGKEKPRRPNPAVGVPRANHHLLGSPSSMTRTATNFPNADHVRQYLKHSADLTMRGGAATSLVYPLATCALAEHYVFRRIGGSSAGAVAAAAAAAAELGRGAPDAENTSSLSVPPGFAGLAAMVGWLAGQDVAGQSSQALANGQEATGWAEQHRLARMVQPSPALRPIFRLVVALAGTRSDDPSGPKGAGGSARRRMLAVAAAVLGAIGRTSRLVVGVVWLGALVAWLGVTLALTRSPGLSGPLVVVTAVALLVTVLLAALAGTAITYVAALRGMVAGSAEKENFGLVPGVDVAARPIHGRLDRWAGVPEQGDVPPLVTWIADRIDDLSGGPRSDTDHSPQTDRYALTFGDLWLGRIGPRSRLDMDLLHRAADDPSLRAIDLALVTTNTSQGRPYTLPFATAERAEREGLSRFLFCRVCLGGVLPTRVVSQMILMSPAQATEASCPRHPGETLHEVPDPWDFPVVAAVRLSMATPGVLRAVPLFTLDIEAPGGLYDEIGRLVSPSPVPSGVFAPRVQWFCDGDLSRSAPVHLFDSLLPRWPTFSFSLDDVTSAPFKDGAHLLAEWLTLPEQDAYHRAPAWRRTAGAAAFASAALDSALGWRDRLQSELPGFRGRIGIVRRGPEDSGRLLSLSQPTILRLALRGYHAGAALRERFTGPDGEVATQTQTDRYRWVRLRMALREYRELSLDIGARLPLYADLAASYRVPGALTTWFTPPIPPGTTDPAWPDAAAAVTHLRALSAGGVLDWDTDYGAPPIDPETRRSPYE